MKKKLILLGILLFAAVCVWKSLAALKQAKEAAKQ